MLEDRKLFLLIFLALAIRVLFAFLPGFSMDVSSWFAWAIRLNEVGFSNFYSPDYFSDYTPGYLYILSFLGFLKNLFQLSDQTFFLLLKLPAIFCEIIIGVLIYNWLYKNSDRFYAILGSSFVLFNPAFIFNSSFWGQIDGVLSLFLLLSIHYLDKKRIMLSSFFLAAAFLIKPHTIALFPLLVLFQLKDFDLKKIARYSFLFLSVVFLLSFPFFTKNPFTGLPTLILNTANQYNYTSLFAYNFWGIFGFWLPDISLWNNLSYQTWGYILFVGYWIVVAYFFFKKKISLNSLAVLANLSFFFLPTRIHERYLYPSLVFLILTASLSRSPRLLLLTVILSLIHFFNLYYVYVYYNEFYLKLPKILYNPILYNFLSTNGKLMSITSTALFMLISIIIIKLQYANKKS